MQKRWVVADTHFHSFHMLRYYEERTGVVLPSPKEYDEIMIRNWNEKISQEDLVYVLGDFSDCPHSLTLDKNLLYRLHGTKVLLIGTHDQDFYTRDYWYHGRIDNTIIKKYWQEAGFSRVVEEKLSINYKGVPVVMSHERLTVKAGTINIFGHNHEFPSKEEFYINVSMPVTGFEPISLESIVLPYADLCYRLKIESQEKRRRGIPETKYTSTSLSRFSKPFADTYEEYLGESEPPPKET